MLENEFKANNNVWAKSKYVEFSRILNVPLSKLYKWNWDRRKKQRKLVKRAQQQECTKAKGLALLMKIKNTQVGQDM